MSISLSLEKMSIEEKLQMMEFLWADLSSRANEAVFPAWHGEVLLKREADVERGTAQFEDWEDAKQKIKDEIQ